MSDVNTTVTSALNSILKESENVDSHLATALMSLGSAINQLNTKQDKVEKELELVRRMTRTNWLMVINMPIPFGLSKGQALQNLLSELDYKKPLFDSERDLLASDILYVNRNGLICNMSFFVAQRHYEFMMGANFQKKIVAHNQKLPKERWISIGRVLTPNERNDYDMACALKRLIISEMNQRRKADPKYPVMFVLVCKRTLRLRIEKQYFTLEEAAARYSIPVEAIVEERKRTANTHAEARVTSKRPASSNNSSEGPTAKTAKHSNLERIDLCTPVDCLTRKECHLQCLQEVCAWEQRRKFYVKCNK